MPQRLHNYWFLSMCTRAPPAPYGAMLAIASTGSGEP